MGRYDRIIRETLFSVSMEQKKFRRALKEWRFTGQVDENEECGEKCELCGHEEIRWSFWIQNIHNSNRLTTGSKCIKLFSQIQVLDANGEPMEGAERNRAINKALKDAIEARRKEAACRPIMHLMEVEKSPMLNDVFLSVYKNKGLTPKQASILFWRLKENGISFEPENYKLRLRSERDKMNLLKMPDWQVERIKPCMSLSQQDWYREARCFMTRYRRDLDTTLQLMKSY